MNDFFKKILNKGLKLCKLKSYNDISFDIFETLIVRKCGKPTNVFDIVEKKYNQIAIDKISNFKENRIYAERKARNLTHKKEITLADIYNSLGDIYDVDICKKLMSIECSVELKQCVCNPPIVSLYKELVKMGKNVYISSDMYLPIDLIRQILEKNGICAPMRIYLSSDCQATKYDGSLFKLLLNEQGIKPNKIVHIGDNIKSDFIMPKLYGMNSFII